MKILTRLAAAVGFVVAVAPALGAGGDGGGSGGGGGGEPMQAAPADPDFEAGVAAVASRDWPQVIVRMGQVVSRDPTNADAHNYLGYAYRHLSQMDDSFRHYETALQLNPKHRGAREYLGEAYLQVGRLEQAEEQLKVLDRLCFFPCEEYRDLKAQIAKYKRERQTAAAQ